MKKLILLSVLSLLICTGCEKFLNVNPVNKAYEGDLFKDRFGFETSLAGVYAILNRDALYGKEMKYGFMESMVGTYNSVNSSHTYYRSSNYQYDFGVIISIINDIWSQHYSAINQVNIMLKYVDELPQDQNYYLIKGELLGLRAFLHFGLLKLFGPVISVEGLSANAIPYRTSSEVKLAKFSTAAEVINFLQKDLEEARTLLGEDPIRKVARTANQNQFVYEKYNSLIDNRGCRMNYYTILGLQALTAQWAGELPRGRAFAEELIKELEPRSNSIHLATTGELSSGINKRMPMESLFSLMNQNLLTQNHSVNPPLEDTRPSNASPLLFANYNYLLGNLYNLSGQGSLNDYRLINWFTRAANSTTSWKITKYHFNVNTPYSDLYYRIYFENKIIGLHQIYMLAAEEYADSNPQKAIEYLNKVRNARNITNNIIYDSNKTSQVIKDMIFDELRKENVGEGMLISEYKRLYKPIHRNTNVEPKVAIFKLPIPVDEQTYNPQ
ncbi:RagB/SusD family nutrient uptake outer membrane protein [Sphingobacterium kyonggiense]